MNDYVGYFTWVEDMAFKILLDFVAQVYIIFAAYFSSLGH